MDCTFTSIDVQFNEQIFPFANTQPKPISPPTHTDLSLFHSNPSPTESIPTSSSPSILGPPPSSSTSHSSPSSSSSPSTQDSRSFATPQPAHPMITRSRTNALRPRQYTDGTIKWPPPRALISISSDIPETPTCYTIAQQHHEWLHKALYGLRQSPRAWYSRLSNRLVDLGFNISTADPSLFLRTTSHSKICVLVYVDDLLITGSSIQQISDLVTALRCDFPITDLGVLRYFLGVEVTLNSKGLLLT
ncbi:pectinesterase inhibitor 10-like [Carya illinoinensis]|uniref:pectinesterase inhibitor 10-like n=1 Tax=Carya illinoinensis TaxID=32201 RepID=UPI001C724C9D|nr:pectinesterase inhibitor 10-like [Carya illinoinensis]